MVYDLDLCLLSILCFPWYNLNSNLSWNLDMSYLFSESEFGTLCLSIIGTHDGRKWTSYLNESDSTGLTLYSNLKQVEHVSLLFSCFLSTHTSRWSSIT